MKTKEIKEQLEMMYAFMDADAELCGKADMSYNYEERLEKNFQIISERLGVSVDEVRLANEQFIHV